MGLSSLNLSKYDTPVKGEVQPGPAKAAGQGGVGEACQLVTIKRTSTGEEILLCMADPAPPEALAEAEKLGMALFTPSEIPHIKAAAAVEPGYIEKLIEIKLVFPGFRVRRFRGEPVA